VDPFENPKQEIYQPPVQENQFPDFNARWIPQFNEGIKTKTGKNLEKGSDIFKKGSSFYIYGLGLTALIIILPAIIRFLYEFSRWAYDRAGNIFP
jgi:hypothetical protein